MVVFRSRLTYERALNFYISLKKTRQILLMMI